MVCTFSLSSRASSLLLSVSLTRLHVSPKPKCHVGNEMYVVGVLGIIVTTLGSAVLDVVLDVRLLEALASFFACCYQRSKATAVVVNREIETGTHGTVNLVLFVRLEALLSTLPFER